MSVLINQSAKNAVLLNRSLFHYISVAITRWSEYATEMGGYFINTCWSLPYVLIMMKSAVYRHTDASLI